MNDLFQPIVFQPLIQPLRTDHSLGKNNCSQVATKPSDLLQQEVYVFLLGGGIGEDASEEVHVGAQGLVANHGRPFLHHLGFDLGGHLQIRGPSQIDTFSTIMPVAMYCLYQLGYFPAEHHGDWTDLMQPPVSVRPWA